MMFLRLVIAGTLIGMMCSSGVFALEGNQDVSVSEKKVKEVTLEESTVRGEYIEIEAISSTKNIKVITRGDMENKGYENLSEVLDDVPGINVSKTGYGEIDIRGQGSRTAGRNIQIMVDGAPIGILTQHPYKTDYNIIPVDQIEKIEIIEGGGAVLYGSGTAGGVINITTNLKGMNKPQNSVGYEYGSEDQHRWFANIGLQPTEKLVLQANYSADDSDLYFKDTFKKGEYVGLGGAYRLTDNQMMSLKYTHYEEEGKYVYNVTAENLKKYGKDYVPAETRVTVGYDEEAGKYLRETKKRYNQSDRESEGFKASHSINFTENLSLMTDLMSQKGSYRNSHYEDKDMDYETKGAKLKLNWGYGEQQNLLFGVDRIDQKACLTVPKYRQKTKDIFDYKKEIKAVFIHNKNRLRNFEFTQGLRLDMTDWITTKPEGAGTKFAGTSATFDNERRNEAYELSSAWLYSDTGRLFARYERGFTTPDGIQMTDDVYVDRKRKLYLPTEAEDEIYDTYEIGMRDYFLNTFLAATAYVTTTDNELNRVSIASDISGSSWKKDKKTMNLLETKRYGVDFSAEHVFGRLRLTEGYTWSMGKTDYNSKGKALIEEGKQIDWSDSGLQKVPEHKVVLTADYDLTSHLTAGVKYKYTGGYANYFDEANKPEDELVDSYETTDLSLRYSMAGGLTLYGGVNNLFDETYYHYVASGSSSSTVWPAFGRTWFVGAKYTF
ncbi:TonB-dependent receptor [Desulfoluna spongiiphila]|uniref:Iron complex outermembrane recepter protein n=1 Tax=Desulfoluna spongiiphila TaxID=419481 RepID=A0A1G5H934_9BACT|nr:TonB-dependent receptor [Desulfoluna spongiiphila]SCY60224.1 iron complex outermembrane recepter protein [Desulfoluna spongiiphila]